jgi:type I restriction enzyme, S subunit
MIQSIYGQLKSNVILTTLGDLESAGKVEIQTGPFGTMLKASSYREHGTPVIAVKNIAENKVIDGDIPRIGEDDRIRLERYSLVEGDIIFGRKGGVDRRAYITVGESGWIQGSDCIRIRFTTHDINPKFVSYLFGTLAFKDWILQNAEGTTMPSLNQSILKRIQIPLFPIENQNYFAEVLGSLDDKIEHNHRMNETLEQMAKALYKYWFVDFGPAQKAGERFFDSELGMIPESWKIFRVCDLIDKFTTGLNPRKHFKLGYGNNYYVTIKNLSNQQVILDERCDKIDDEALNKINKRSDLQVNDILFSAIGTIGRTYYIDKKPTNWNISESLFTLRANENLFHVILYRLLLSDQFQNFATQSASGSVQRGIRKADIENYKIALPEKNVQNEISIQLSDILKKQKQLENENNTLIETRGFLLPHMLSDEISM